MADAIFVHAWWRSGSTYIWSKLRQSQSHCCYYEPLHEKIALLTADAAEAPPDRDASKASRHPIPEKNYFAEYADLLRCGSLRYSQDLAYGRYLLERGETDEQLRLYLEGLISGAGAAARRPVLCFCRSQMRSVWIKETFGGIHVAQIRNPSDQWTSFHIEPYFINKLIIIALSLRRSHPGAFAHIESFERLAQDLARRPSLPAEMIFKFFSDQIDARAVFLVIWIASALQAIACCDFLLDIDRLSTDSNYRKVTSRWFESIDCSVDFSDCSLPSSNDVRDPLFERTVQDAAKAVRSNASSLVVANPGAVEKWLPSLSPLSRRVLVSALGGE